MQLIQKKLNAHFYKQRLKHVAFHKTIIVAVAK